jgi:hypothetical protein
LHKRGGWRKLVGGLCPDEGQRAKGEYMNIDLPPLPPPNGLKCFHSIPSYYITYFILLKLLEVSSCRSYIVMEFYLSWICL